MHNINCNLIDCTADVAGVFNSIIAGLDNKKLPAIEAGINLTSFDDFFALNKSPLATRLASAIAVFLQCFEDYAALETKLDSSLIDFLISSVDHMLSEAVDAILHAEKFQQCESVWRSLHYLLADSNDTTNIQLDILPCAASGLRADFNDNSISNSLLYKLVYTQAYDMPGADPYAFILAADSFAAGQSDIALLRSIAKISALAHCPFIAGVNARFFLKDNMAQVSDIKDWRNHFQRPEYQTWQAFRQDELSRHVSLVFPRFLLRQLYGEDNPVNLFNYTEQVNSDNPEQLLWGSAAFALARNMLRSFLRHGWMVNIRGPQSGGKVDNLPLPMFKAAGVVRFKPPIEILIPETQELELATAGLVPLSYYMGSNFACFFSANSVHLPTVYDCKDATANSRANVRLPYVLLCSRLAHYLKVLQREHIGLAVDASKLAASLNRWLQSLVTEMENPEPAIMARFPLRAASVKVHALEDNPGYFAVALNIVPHFHLEGMAVQLSLLSRLPRGHEPKK